MHPNHILSRSHRLSAFVFPFFYSSRFALLDNILLTQSRYHVAAVCSPFTSFLASLLCAHSFSIQSSSRAPLRLPLLYKI
ncbi:hypothetical protein F5888DRAFT_1775783 [Russula emetica]|nr:hypothetical protein F5888DRAFT_1775679 [Russula emetica]KAF8483229.1 hypothetical protein F5888DRAFT_1775783 [Russula emetica]